jgi:hypothetical protein
MILVVKAAAAEECAGFAQTKPKKLITKIHRAFDILSASEAKSSREEFRVIVLNTNAKYAWR